jgi:hypothetical protein
MRNRIIIIIIVIVVIIIIIIILIIVINTIRQRTAVVPVHLNCGFSELKAYAWAVDKHVSVPLTATKSRKILIFSVATAGYANIDTFYGRNGTFLSIIS